MTDLLAALSTVGVSIWLDDLSRERLVSGGLSALVRDQHVVGVTTNPTIFAKAITGGDAYDDQIRDLATRGVGVAEALRALTAFDVRWACDVLRPVDRPNLFIKIPAARQALPAITACLAKGISINVTLIFSLSRYDEVMDAFLDGLEGARRAGVDLSRIGSVASFFVSRVDTEVDQRLDKIGTDEAAEVRGETAIANARVAYAQYERVFSSTRWQKLAAAGARPQRPLWASTSVKDPAYSDTRYVLELVAPGVVNTMPEATLRAVADHGVVPADSVRDHYATARQVLDRLAALGIDYDAVVQTLEDQAVATFDASWEQLGEELEARLSAATRPASASRPGDI